MAIQIKDFGALPCGKEAKAFTLSNSSDTVVTVSDFGATLVDITTPDKNGKVSSLVCGFDSVSGYLTKSGYQGALVGRTCNRISNAEFTLDGEKYTLAKNHGKHQIHGGKDGFSFRFWNFDLIDGEEPAVVFSRISPDGEEGYPGNLTVSVTYKLKADGSLSMCCRATCDKRTIVNMTNHSYFNLDGIETGNINSHYIRIDADKINAVDEDLIPTGGFIDVEGTPYDLRTEKKITAGFSSDHPLMRMAGGYDNCYNVNNFDGSIKLIAEVYAADSGRRMKVYTDQPCVQLYTANNINEEGAAYRGGVSPRKHGAFCLETQKMPDSINHPGFTDVTLSPGQEYVATTVFAIEK